MKSINVSVILPAYNEEDYLQQTIQGIKEWPINPEIIIVDDGSIDHTKEIMKVLAEMEDIYPLFLDENVGKGKALMAGIGHAHGDILIFLDADLGISANKAYHLLFPILEEDVDMTIAILPKPQKKGGFGLAKNLAKRGIYYLTGVEVIAPLSGQRAFKRRIIDDIPHLMDGFGIEVGFTIDVLNNGFTIKEVNVPLTHRETGRNVSGFVHRGKEFVAVLRTLLFKWRKQHS